VIFWGCKIEGILQVEMTPSDPAGLVPLKYRGTRRSF